MVNRLVGVIDDDAAAVPAGREGVAQNVITASGVPRADIKTNGLWVVTNGVGAYTAPTPATTGQTRDRRRITLARNIIKNWLPAGNGLLAIADAAVNLRLGVQLDAMCAALPRMPALMTITMCCWRSPWSTALTLCCMPGRSGITARTDIIGL